MSTLKSLLQQPQQIAYCLGATNYSWIHFRNGEKKLVAKTISVLEAQLPGFIRIHKRVLLNPDCLKSAYQLPRKKGEGEVHLESGAVFPVSRRRWSVLDHHLRTLPAESTPQAIAQAVPPRTRTPPPASLASFILLVTDDPEKAHRTKQLLHQTGSTYGLQTIPPRTLLATLGPPYSPLVSPTLILLDAQTVTAERMNILRTLKATPQLSHIPVILFVPPTDQFVVGGYQSQANSVVALPNSGLVFEQHLERILHYWLQFVALPG